MRRSLTIGVALLFVLGVTGGRAVAQGTYYGYDRPSPPRVHRHTFYPEDVSGGVKGNLPFNNQLRKLSDPLNANGGR